MRRLYAGETHTARSLTGACLGTSLAELLSVPALTQIKYDRPAPGRAKNFKCESSRTVQFLHERHQCFQQHRSYRRAGEIRDLESDEQSQQTRRMSILCNLIISVVIRSRPKYHHQKLSNYRRLEMLFESSEVKYTAI